MLSEHFVESGLVGNVELVIDGAFAGNQLNAIENFVGRVIEVVDNHDFVVGLEEGESGEGANVAGATKREISRLCQYNSGTIAASSEEPMAGS